MRANRLSGSEGGAGELPLFLPLSDLKMRGAAWKEARNGDYRVGCMSCQLPFSF